MKSIFAAVVALVAAVSAQANIVSITSPLSGTVYTAGQPAIITWIDQQVPVISKIALARGQPTALQPVATIAENVDASAGTYVWNVPQDITPAEDYAFELGSSPNISFTGLFTIKAADGAAPAAVTTAAPATSSAASSSIPACTPAASSSTVKAAAASQAAGSLVVESSGLKISTNKAAVGAVVVAAGAAAALI
ncbi:hypothetical protein K501DRAFT_219425 [Backusella circina FSU 941]|nr:hypothetical protein K501DRAFT_219425 [Backusella circina FSU 941]